MKIAQIAPVWERVPPTKYGGIELIVFLLTEELVKRGHDVTLFASGDSATKAKLVSVYPMHTREHMGSPCPDLLHVGNAFKRAGEFDIVHNHAGYSGVTLSYFIDTPVLTTLHGIFTKLNEPLFRAFKDACYYNAISKEQMKNCPELNYVGVIYNAVDIHTYPFSVKKDDFYVNIGRIAPIKGTHLAIEVAKKAGIKLVLAGKIDLGADRAYFEHDVKPHIDGKKIKFLGEVTEEQKRNLFRDAKGFIFPLQWSEPFGLVMVEAMVCGTPVLSLPYGAVPEVLESGKTGFIVNSIEEMVEAVPKLEGIDPSVCRKHVEEHFSVEKMCDGYETAYKTMLKNGKKS